MKPEAFGNPKFSGSSPLNEQINCWVLPGQQMSLELQSLAVFGLSRKAQKVFPRFFLRGRNWRSLFGSYKKYSNMAAWHSFPMGIFQVFFTRLVDIHNWSRYRSTLVVVSTAVIENLWLRSVFIGKNLLSQYSSGSCSRHLEWRSRSLNLFPTWIKQKMGCSEMIAANVG